MDLTQQFLAVPKLPAVRTPSHSVDRSDHKELQRMVRLRIHRNLRPIKALARLMAQQRRSADPEERHTWDVHAFSPEGSERMET